MDPTTRSTLAARIKRWWAVSWLAALLLVGLAMQHAAFSDTPTTLPQPQALCLWRAVNVLYDLDATSGFATASEAVEALASRVDETLPPYQVVPTDDPAQVMLLDEQDRAVGHAGLVPVANGGVVVDTLAICLEVPS